MSEELESVREIMNPLKEQLIELQQSKMATSAEQSTKFSSLEEELEKAKADIESEKLQREEERKSLQADLDQVKGAAEDLDAVRESKADLECQLAMALDDNNHLKSAADDLVSVKESKNALEIEVTKLTEEKAQLLTATQDLAATKESKTILEIELTKLTDEKEQLKKAEDILTKQVDDLKSFQGTDDYNRLKAQFDEKLVEKNKEVADIQGLLEEQAKAHSEEIEKLKLSSLESITSSEGLDNLKIDLEKSNNLNSDLTTQVNELKEALENNLDGNSIVAALKEEVDKLKEENFNLKEASRNVFNHTGHNEMEKEELKSLTCELNQLRLNQEKFCSVQDENNDLKNKLVSVQNNYDNLKLSTDKMKKYQTENEELKEIMDRMSADIEAMRDSSRMAETYDIENKALKRKVEHLMDVNRELEKLKSRSSQLVDIEKENHDMQDCLRKLEEELAEVKALNADLSEKNENVDKLSVEVAEKEKKFMAVQLEMDKLKLDAKKAAEVSEELVDLKEAYESVNNELCKVKADQEDMEDSNRMLKLKADSLDTLKVEFDRIESANADLKTEFSRMESANADLKSSFEDKLAANTDLQQQISDLQTIKSELELALKNQTDEKAESNDTELAILREANIHLQERITTMQKDAGAAESLAAELEDLRLKCRQLQQLEADYGAKEDKLTEVQEELDCLKSSVDELSEMQDEYQQLKVKEQEYLNALGELESLRATDSKLAALQNEHDSLRSKGLELAERLKTRNVELDEAQIEILRLQQIEEAYKQQVNSKADESIVKKDDFEDQLKAKDEEILEVQEELAAWRYKSQEIMTLLSSDENPIESESELFARIKMLKCYEEKSQNKQLDETKSGDHQHLIITLETDLEEYKSKYLEQTEQLQRLQAKHKSQEECNERLNIDISALRKEVQQLKANIVANESIMNDTAGLTRAGNYSIMNDTARLTRAGNDSIMNDTARLTAAANESIIYTYAANESFDDDAKVSNSKSRLGDNENTCSMDFTIGAPGFQHPGLDLTNAGGSDLMSELAAGGLNETSSGSDLMSELAAATQRNRTLKVRFLYISPYLLRIVFPKVKCDF